MVIPQNHNEPAKNTYWGWVPILTRTFYFTCRNSDEEEYIKAFCDIDKANIDEILSRHYEKGEMSYSDEQILSDDKEEIRQRKKHKIELDLIDIGEIIKLKIRIKSPNTNIILASGTANIHANGLVEYQMDVCAGTSSNCASQLHKKVRDIFHEHDHHSSDLLLPPIPVDENDKSYNDAIYGIADKYIQKFIIYKKFSSRVKPKAVLEDLFRALGEVQYANAFLDINKQVFNENDLNNYINTFDSFSKSFDILIKRLQNRLRISQDYLLCGITIYLLSATIMLLESDMTKLLDSFSIISANIFSKIIIYLLVGMLFMFGTYFVMRYYALSNSREEF